MQRISDIKYKPILKNILGDICSVGLWSLRGLPHIYLPIVTIHSDMPLIIIGVRRLPLLRAIRIWYKVYRAMPGTRPWALRLPNIIDVLLPINLFYILCVQRGFWKWSPWFLTWSLRLGCRLVFECLSQLSSFNNRTKLLTTVTTSISQR